jgi:predicted Zn-dependent protease
MDAYRRRLPRPLRRLLGVPIAPAAGLAWLGHRVLLRVVRRRTKPEETALWRAWAVHSLRHGQLVIARMAAEYMVAAEPDAPDGYYLLHRAYLRAGERAGARAVLERGLRIAPTDTQLRLAQAALNELGQGGNAAANQGEGTRRRA